jgi:hypothetical protein
MKTLALVLAIIFAAGMSWADDGDAPLKPPPFRPWQEVWQCNDVRVQESNHRRRRLLRARCERPHGRAAEQRDECTPSELIGWQGPLPASFDLQNIELARVSQRVCEPFQGISDRDYLRSLV